MRFGISNQNYGLDGKWLFKYLLHACGYVEGAFSGFHLDHISILFNFWLILFQHSVFVYSFFSSYIIHRLGLIFLCLQLNQVMLLKQRISNPKTKQTLFNNNNLLSLSYEQKSSFILFFSSHN